MADLLLNRFGSEIELNASNVEFDNTTSGLTATDAQGAIDEIVADLNTVDVSPVVTSGNKTATVTLADGSTVDLFETVIGVSAITNGFRITKENGTTSDVTFAEIDSATVNPKMTVSLDGVVLYTQPINKNDIQIDNAGSDFDLTDDELSFVETNGDTATISFAKYNVSSATLPTGDITISQNGTVLATISQNASGIAYDNTASGSTATEVQGALNELFADSHVAVTVDPTSNVALTVDATTQVAKLDLEAAGSYDNATSGLTADSVQEAIDELAVLAASGAVVKENFTATAGQVTFTLANSAVSLLVTTRNGVNVDGFTVAGTTVTYAPASNGGAAMVAGDLVKIVYVKA